MSSEPKPIQDEQAQRKWALLTKLDLALGYARLASHFVDTGRLETASEQKDRARQHYEDSINEWIALGLDGDAGELLTEKRQAVEDCLEKLKRGDSC